MESQAIKYQAEVEGYFNGVLDGSVVASKKVRAMVARHRKDLLRPESDGLHFSPSEAAHAIDFAPFLSHSKGEFAGKPFELRTWQKALFWILFGWRRSDGTRRYRYCFISVGRGNGKSPLAALIANLLLFCDSPFIEPRAEIYAIATKREQAKSAVWDEARKQIESNEELRSLAKIGVGSIVLEGAPYNGSFFKPEGSNYKTSDSWILHAVIIDELHAWARQSAQELFDKAETAMAKRRQPMMVIITTAGDESSEVWRREYDFYSKVIEGQIESDQHFAFIAEVDSEDDDGKKVDPLDERVWPMANPMLNEPDSPVKLEALRGLAVKAKNDAGDRVKFRRYFANQPTNSVFKFVSTADWNLGDRPVPNVTGWECMAGFDFGWRDDLCSLVLCFPRNPDPGFYLKTWNWIPADTPRDLNKPPWSTFINEGYVRVTHGDTTDVDEIYATFQDLNLRYHIRSLAADGNNCREFLTRVNNQWGVPVYSFSQKPAKYNEPTRAMIDYVRRGEIIHGGDKVLAWCASNAMAREDSNGHRKPEKTKSGDKIDTIQAAVMALSECMYHRPKICDYQGDL